MKKLLKNFFIAVISASAALTTLACTYDFHIDFHKEKAKSAIAYNIASKSADIIKSQIIGSHKKINSFTVATDLLLKKKNNDLNSTSIEKAINFLNEKVNINATDNSTEKKIDELRKINKNLEYSKNITSITSLPESLLRSIVFDNGVSNKIITFLNEIKKTDVESMPKYYKTFLPLLKNSVFGNGESNWKSATKSLFKENFIEPFNSFIDNLMNGNWGNGKSTPKDINELSEYMVNWKDKDGRHFSSWVWKYEWNLSKDITNSWNQNDYNAYKGGVLFNQLFYKVGKENNLQRKNLGDIISKFFNLSNIVSAGINGPNAVLHDITSTLKNYLNLIFSNTSYIFQLFEALLPLIMHTVFSSNDSGYNLNKVFFNKNDKNQKSFLDLKDFIQNIKRFIDNPEEKIRDTVSAILLGNKSSHPLRAFLYDIKINILIMKRSLPELLSNFNQNNEKNIDIIVNKIMSFIDKYLNKIKEFFNVFCDYFNYWADKYRNITFDFDLTEFKNLLFNKTGRISLLKIINDQIIGSQGTKGLFDIMKSKEEIKQAYDEEFKGFYETIIGNVNKLPSNDGFKKDSLIAFLINIISEQNGNEKSLLNLILGYSNKSKKSIVDSIIEENEKFINDNYGIYLEQNEKSKLEITNLKSSETYFDNAQHIKVSYDMKYKIDNKEYKFYVSGVQKVNLETNTGIVDFYFTDIKITE